MKLRLFQSLKAFNAQMPEAKFILFIVSFGLTINIVAVVGAHRALRVDEPTVWTQLDDLKVVQRSLEGLQKYVEQQQNNVKATAEQLDALSKQKGELENVLSVDRPKMEALLAAINKQSAKGRWLEYSLSFLTGIFTSLIAAIIYDWSRRRGLKLQTEQSNVEQSS